MLRKISYCSNNWLVFLLGKMIHKIDDGLEIGFFRQFRLNSRLVQMCKILSDNVKINCRLLLFVKFLLLLQNGTYSVTFDFLRFSKYSITFLYFKDQII